MEPIKQTVENNLDSFAFRNYRMGEVKLRAVGSCVNVICCVRIVSPAESTDIKHCLCRENKNWQFSLTLSRKIQNLV